MTTRLHKLWAETHAAISQYEEDIANGVLTFTHGEFADEPPDMMGGWVQALAHDHLSLMDAGEMRNDATTQADAP